MKKVSVVVPCYNASMYLHKCVDHLLTQTIGLENMEIILVNDASTDDGKTWEIITDYERQYPEAIIAISLPENLRQGGARNVGVSYAGGEYLVFCDADDWLMEEALERLYRAAIEHNADIVECSAKSVGDNTIEVREIEKGSPYSAIIDLDVEDNRNYFIRGADLNFSLGSQKKLYRLSMIKDNNIRFVEHLIFEEPSFVLPARLYAKRYYFFNEALYIYYSSPGSTLRGDWSDRRWDNAKVWLYIMHELIERGVWEKYHDDIEFTFAHWYLGLTLRVWHQKGYVIGVSDLQQMQDTVLDVFPGILQNRYLIEESRRDVWSDFILRIMNLEISEESTQAVNQILRQMCHK